MLGGASLSQPRASNTLEVEVDLETGNLTTSLPDKADNPLSGSRPFSYDQVGLPAILKLLNVEAFRQGDYFDSEVAYLLQRGYVVDGLDPAGGPAIARDLHRKLGSEFFDLLFPAESMRRVFENAYRLPHSLHVQLSFKAEARRAGPAVGAALP